MKHYIGIDISSKDFAGSIFLSPNLPFQTRENFTNNPEGFDSFQKWLNEQGIRPQGSVICLEATGVYTESLCYSLVAKGYKVAVEAPLKVKRSFNVKGHKNDKVDSRKIAEYAYRYYDELRYWQPGNEIVEQLQVLLMAREQFVQQKTATINILTALKRKVIQTPLVNQLCEENIESIKKRIIKIEEEMEQLVLKNPFFKTIVTSLDSIPSVGSLLAINFLVATQGFESPIAVQYKKASAYVGICPYEHTSGSSVYKKPTSVKYGPSRLRKLLHLAARCLIVHHEDFKIYYLRKAAQGKPKKLVLNNIANKLLKIMCAIIRTRKPYIKGFISIHPNLV